LDNIHLQGRKQSFVKEEVSDELMKSLKIGKLSINEIAKRKRLFTG